MIQRIQSVWLLLAAVFAIVTLNQPFKFGNTLGLPATNFTGSSDFSVLVLTIIVSAFSFFIIFLFKNRNRQFWFTILDLVLSLLLIVFYFVKTKDWLGNVSLTSVFLFLIPLFIFFAARGISKDKKLLKSVDRLRD